MIILEYFLSSQFSLPDFKAAAGAFHLDRFILIGHVQGQINSA